MAVGQGLVRLRYLQTGKQSVFGTAVAATKKVAWRGQIQYEPNRARPDVDEGSIDPIAADISGAPDITLDASGPILYNNHQINLSAALKGGVTSTGGGSTKTSDFQVASLSADPFDYYTIESGDDTSATFGIQAYGGVIDSLVEEMPQDLGPWTFTAAWIFGGANLATDKTGALTADTTGVYALGDETAFYLDTAAGSIGISPLTDTVHAATITVNNNLDKKRLANGSNSRKKYAGWARGDREILLAITVAETSAIATEVATIDDDPPPNRFFSVVTTSATSPYAYTRRGAFRLRSVSDTEIDGNACKVLTYAAYYDATLGYAYRATLVNTVAV